MCSDWSNLKCGLKTIAVAHTGVLPQLVGTIWVLFWHFSQNSIKPRFCCENILFETSQLCHKLNHIKDNLIVHILHTLLVKIPSAADIQEPIEKIRKHSSYVTNVFISQHWRYHTTYLDYFSQHKGCINFPKFKMISHQTKVF